MRFFHITQNKRGFTLVEVLVAVGIVLVLASVVFFSVGGVKKNSRDKQRVSDIQQLIVAFRMYREMNSINPAYPSGIVIGEGGVLDSAATGLGTYLAGILRGDPRGSATDTTYEYVYDSDYICQGVAKTVLYVKTMENASEGNWASICGTYSGGTSASTYGVIIGPSQTGGGGGGGGGGGTM